MRSDAGFSAPRVVPPDLGKHLCAELVDGEVIRQHLRMEDGERCFLDSGVRHPRSIDSHGLLLRLQLVVTLEVETAQGRARFLFEPIEFVDVFGVDDEWWDI
jgi:hypothetical protein